MTTADEPPSTLATVAGRRQRAGELWQSGMTYAQVAAQMGVAPGTVAAWLHRLRKDGADLPRTKAPPWTPADDERLLDMLAGDRSVREVALALGRTTDAVSSRLRELRATHPSAPGLSIGARVSWTQAKDDALISQYQGGATHEQIAADLGCSAPSVFLRLGALRGAGVDVPLRKPRWTAEQQARLASRRREGATYKQLSAEFGRSHGTISAQLRRLRQSGVDLTPDSAS